MQRKKNIWNAFQIDFSYLSRISCKSNVFLLKRFTASSSIRFSGTGHYAAFASYMERNWAKFSSKPAPFAQLIQQLLQ